MCCTELQYNCRGTQAIAKLADMDVFKTNSNEVIIEQCAKKELLLVKAGQKRRKFFVVIILKRLNRETIVSHKFVLLERKAMVNSTDKNYEGKKTVPSYFD